MANLGVIQALLGKEDAVFEDRLNHASLIDGGLASGARFRRYLHNDAASLESALQGSSARRKLVVSDGVFSMDGDVAPLADLAQVCERQQAWLMIDDAHGFGVLGHEGGGCVAAQNMQQQVPVLIGTLGKAFGTFGAFVVGSDDLIETMIQFARPYIYTTALPPAVAAASLASLQLLRKDQWRREKLGELVARFRQGAVQKGFQLMDSATPIQPLMIGADKDALALSQRLRERGFLISAIRPPTVAEGTARLRITLSASHQPEDIDRLIEAL
jgi:8-amino-7-oxononanoate synthase